MGSDDKYEEPLPACPRLVVFQDPFADVEGGIGNLSIAREANRAHASSNATSTISTQCTVFDRDNDSAVTGSITSTTGTSREGSPSKSLLERGIEGGDLSMPLPPRDNDLVLPFAEAGLLDKDLSASPSSSVSTWSFEPDITPRSCSNVGYHDRNASFDGGAELLKSHGARLSPIPFTTSPASMTRSASVAASIQSFRSAEYMNDEWDTETLREMTDVVREALQLGSIPSANLEILSEILKAFDKTLDAILSHTNQNIAIAEASIQEIFSRATSLQHKWQQRFKERYKKVPRI